MSIVIELAEGIDFVHTAHMSAPFARLCSALRCEWTLSLSGMCFVRLVCVLIMCAFAVFVNN